jgi:Domain of unknown function (DUF4386)
MGSTITRSGLRRTTGGLLVMGAVGFAVAATVLSVTFDWPDILREPGSVVLPAFAAGSASLVWTWLATSWTYAILAVPILLLPAVLGRRDDPAMRVATYVGAGSVALSLIGFLRWVEVCDEKFRYRGDADPSDASLDDMYARAKEQRNEAVRENSAAPGTTEDAVKVLARGQRRGLR